MTRNGQYDLAVRRLADQLGADVIFDMPERQPAKSRVELAKARARIPDEYDGHAWYPPGRPAQCAIVWDWAYGPERDGLRERERWHDRVARCVHQVMTLADWSRNECAYISLSRDTKDTETGRVPAVDRAGLLRALDAADTEAVILMGASAVRAWHPVVKLDQVAGRIGAWKHWWVMPVHHPNAVLRGIVTADDWRRAFATFREQLDDGDRGFMLDPSCAARRCRETVKVYDHYGIGWCDGHLEGIRQTIETRSPRQPQRERLL